MNWEHPKPDEDSLPCAWADYSSLGTRSWDDIRSMEIFKGVRIDAEPIIVPKELLPHTTICRLSSRSLFVTKRLLSGISPRSSIHDRIDEALRRTLLALLLPHQTNSGVRRYSISTW